MSAEPINKPTDIIHLSESNASRTCTCGNPATAYAPGTGFVCSTCHDPAPDDLAPTDTPDPLQGGWTDDRPAAPEATPSTGGWNEDLEVSVYGEQNWLLPGMGDGADSCGTWYPKHFCDEAGHLDLGRQLCGRRDCPTCWKGQWARPRTVSVVERLAAARHVEDPGIDRRTVHTVVSPPEGTVQSIQEFYSAKREAVDIAKEHGVRGGLVVPHAYRVNQEHKDLFRAKAKTGEWDPSTDGGIWRWVRENRRDWRDQVKWSPHFHVIGLSRDVEGRDRDDGWIVENIKRGGSHGLEAFHNLTDTDGYNDMIAVVRYLLSHATFAKDENRQVVTWFGSIHPSNFNPDPTDDNKQLDSPLTTGAWRKIVEMVEKLVGGTDDRGGESGPDDDLEACPVDGCGGELHPIWEAGRFLEQRRDDLERENEHRLAKAFEWATGDVQPPPGLKRPRTEAQAKEALEALL